MASNGVVSPQQARAVAALLENTTVAEAARSAGVGARTLVRWLSEDVFRAELRRAQDECVGRAVMRLVSGVGRALDTLAGVMDDAELPAGVRVRAAGLWLDATLRWAELADIERRVAALEETLGGRPA